MDEKIDEKKFLKTLSDEIHKPALRKYPTRQVFALDKDNTWGMDLADMQTWKNEAGEYQYILVVIDVFTRWASARAMKSKTGKETLEALKSIVEERGTTPKKLWIDEGKEFLNKEMKAFCRIKKITMYHTHGQGKSVIVERFNRTLKTNMWKNLTATNSHNWPPILPKLLSDYNGRVHGTLGFSPNYASKHPEAARKVWNARFDKQEVVLKTKYQVGNHVRISRIKGKFEKGYDANWSQEIYHITKVLNTSPVTYTLADYQNKEITGSFYDQELQKTKLNDIALVEKILDRKKRGKKEMILVKWLGYPESANSWIDTKDSVKL